MNVVYKSLLKGIIWILIHLLLKRIRIKDSMITSTAIDGKGSLPKDRMWNILSDGRPA